jgi:hypothetical protein
MQGASGGQSIGTGFGQDGSIGRVADLDPKAKALEDYDAAAGQLLDFFESERLSKQPHPGQSIAESRCKLSWLRQRQAR